MSDIPEWPEAVNAFQAFLEANRHPRNIRWVFRDDLHPREMPQVLVRAMLPNENAALAAKVFTEGRQKGLVEMIAIATTGFATLASVWYPKYPSEEVQGWDRGMKLSIRQPLLRARPVSSMKWAIVTFLPSYRRAQQLWGFVGTRAWAAA
jgi:hypothetical protein